MKQQMNMLQMKKKKKNETWKESNKVQIGNLSIKEFRIITNMIRELRRRISEQR